MSLRFGQLKVMISSTSLDLPRHREAAKDAVLRAGYFPVAMEHESASSDSNAIQSSLAMVEQADIYVGIFAQRYGFIPDNKEENLQGWSVTEHEYRRAVALGIPRLIYLADKKHDFTVEEIDFDPEKRARLQSLKEELEQREHYTHYQSPQELHSRIIESLLKETKKHGLSPPAAPPPAPTIPHPPELYAVPPYTLTNTFVGRRAELAELDAWAASIDRVLVVEAVGGMGKSALTWEWVQQRAETHIPELAGRVWWSFYERGTSMRTFLRHALAYVIQQDPESLLNLDTYDCSQRLLTELNRRPYLLVLDGFERVLTAYHRIDKAQLPDNQVPADVRETTNPKDGDVLRQLVHCGPSKVLVSTRLVPKVLEDRHTHQPIPGVRRLALKGLAPKDALVMVHHAGIHGRDDLILRFADQFRRHALVLRIVCGMITDYRPQPGDFEAWRADPYAGGGLKLSELPLKQRNTHILHHAFRGLEEKIRQLLSRIAALSDSADYALTAALNPFPPDALVDFHTALGDLENRGLLEWDRKANTYNLHPVVRAYAFDQLEEQDRTQTYNVIRDHFASLPPEKVRQATELADVKNSIEIMRALIGAGRLQEAMHFYQGDLRNSLLLSIGAYHNFVELISPLVRRNRSSVPALSEAADQSSAMIDLVYALTELGRIEEAISLSRDKLFLDLESRSWYHLAIGLLNLSSSTLKRNSLASSERAQELAHDLAAVAGQEDVFTASLLDLMLTATRLGRFEKAEELLTSFRQRRQPYFALYQPGEAEYLSAVLQFFQGRLAAADLDLAEQVARDERNLSFQHYVATLRAEWELTRDNPGPALDAIEHALSIVRRTGTPAPDYLGLRALALARLGHSFEASETLSEAKDAWKGWTPQFPLFAAEAWLALGNHDEACKFARQAYRVAWAEGPPYIHWYYLKQCCELMAKLGEPEPQLPPFDPDKVEPIPYEAEIRAVIERLKAKGAKNKADEVE